MKVKDLLEYLNKLPKEMLEKELTFYDYENNVSYNTPAIPMVVDESDVSYLDLVFNYTKDWLLKFINCVRMIRNAHNDFTFA